MSTIAPPFVPTPLMIAPFAGSSAARAVVRTLVPAVALMFCLAVAQSPRAPSLHPAWRPASKETYDSFVETSGLPSWAIAIGLPGTHWTEPPNSGGCPAMEVVTDFDAKRYSGRWYAAYSNGMDGARSLNAVDCLASESGCRGLASVCNAAEYTAVEGGMLVENQAQFKGTDGCVNCGAQSGFRLATDGLLELSDDSSGRLAATNRSLDALYSNFWYQSRTAVDMPGADLPTPHHSQIVTIASLNHLVSSDYYGFTWSPNGYEIIATDYDRYAVVHNCYLKGLKGWDNGLPSGRDSLFVSDFFWLLTRKARAGCLYGWDRPAFSHYCVREMSRSGV